MNSSHESKSSSNISIDKEENTKSTTKTIMTIGSTPSSTNTFDKEDKNTTTASKISVETTHDQEELK